MMCSDAAFMMKTCVQLFAPFLLTLARGAVSPPNAAALIS